MTTSQSAVRFRLLHQALEGSEPMTLEALAQRVRVPTAVVNEDLRTLKDRMGAPLRYEGGGYVYSEPFDLPLIGLVVGGYEIVGRDQAFGPLLAWKVRAGDNRELTLFASAQGEHIEATSRTLLRMGHPQFVRVVDRGFVSADEARGGGPKLRPNMGWFVVAGTYEPFSAPGRVTWRAIFDLAHQLLELAAYAHAHGCALIRLGPGRLLQREGKVVLAHLLDDAGVESLPLANGFEAPFQAPERNGEPQRRVAAAEDLYAIGCTLYHFITGEPPHRGAGPNSVRGRQTTDALPPFSKRLELPSGFRSWLALMLDVDPAARFESAADARAGLVELDRLRGARRWRATQARLPSDWRRNWQVAPYDPRAIRMLALRPMPFVGRSAERDSLWAAATEASGSSLLTGRVLTAPPGVGRSRLLSWLKHRLIEAGGPRVLAIRCNAGDLPGLVMARLVLALCACDGEDVTAQQLGEALAAKHLATGYAQQAIVALVGEGLGKEDWPRHRFARFDDRIEMIAPLLVRAARQRDLAVLVDDAQWGNEVAPLMLQVARMAESERFGFAFFLGLEALDPKIRPTAVRQMDQLLALPKVEGIDLAPLPLNSLTSMFMERLRLGQVLAQRLAAASGALPTVAQQMLVGWNEAGALVMKGERLSLRPGAAPPAPERTTDFWAERIKKLIAQNGGDPDGSEYWALEAAAVLGRSVSHQLWTTYLKMLGIEVPWSLVTKAVQAGLVWPDVAGWRFQYGDLRRALLISAGDNDRLTHYRRAYAKMIHHQYGDTTAARIQRGEQLVLAGDAQEAFDVLSGAVALDAYQGDEVGAARAMDLAARALSALPPKGRLAGSLRLEQLRAVMYFERGDFKRSIESAMRSAKLGEAVGDMEYVIEAHRRIARCAFEVGAYDEATRRAVAVQKLAEQHGAWRQVALGELLLGQLARANDEDDRAVACFTSARTRAERHCADDIELKARVNYALGAAKIAQGLTHEGLPRLLEAYRAWDAVGGHSGLGKTAFALADAARRQGDIAVATKWLERARKAFGLAGAWETWQVALGLGALLVDAGVFGEAKQAIAGATDFFEATRRLVWASASRVFQVADIVAHERWDEFDFTMDQEEAFLRKEGFVDPYLAIVLERTATLAIKLNKPARAARCLTLAVEQWLGLEETGNAQKAAQWLKSLPGRSS